MSGQDPTAGQKLTKKQLIAKKKQERQAAKERRGSDDEDFEADLQDSRFAVSPVHIFTVAWHCPLATSLRCRQACSLGNHLL